MRLVAWVLHTSNRALVVEKEKTSVRKWLCIGSVMGAPRYCMPCSVDEEEDEVGGERGEKSGRGWRSSMFSGRSAWC